MSEFYAEKEWPSLPDALVSSLTEWGLSADRAVPAKGKPDFSLLKAPWYLREWVSENIPIDIDESWMVTLQRFNTVKADWHIDLLRDCSYNCLIFGESGVTQFKPNFASQQITSVKYKKNKWYYHNSAVPHAVHSIPRKRVAVTMFKFLPRRLSESEAFNGTAPLLAAEYEKDPYFYYV
ncbi:hypothetical protein [Alteromonas mediterranea]|uniref:hypothetical protein n=1 Tax=Alteromonas mediterranea TaxID=314275 RepID=UPI0032B247E3